ncbi:MAG: hypothetical protein OEZ47_11615 [Gammaproteobacteria bacterium]|nr:hypothetical protein [Gammaproteobacteria bacterium]
MDKFDELEYSHEGQRATTVHVSFHGDRLLIRESLTGAREETRTEVTPSTQQWKTFYRDIESSRVWQWPRECVLDSICLDGLFWSLKIRAGERCHESSGCNAYPFTRKHMASKEFAQFVNAVFVLAGLRR